MVNPWDQRYSNEEFYYGTDPNDFLRKTANSIKKNGRVLCLAEGEGRNAVWLVSQGFQVTGVDGSEMALRKLQRLAHERGVQVETVHADLEHFQIQPSTWDGIVSIWCHLPKALRKKIHSQVISGLRSGGTLILEAYTPRQLEFKTGGPPTADLMPTLDELREELVGSEISSALELERGVHEGVGHNRTSARSCWSSRGRGNNGQLCALHFASSNCTLSAFGVGANFARFDSERRSRTRVNESARSSSGCSPRDRPTGALPLRWRASTSNSLGRARSPLPRLRAGCARPVVEARRAACGRPRLAGDDTAIVS